MSVSAMDQVKEMDIHYISDTQIWLARSTFLQSLAPDQTH